MEVFDWFLLVAVVAITSTIIYVGVNYVPKSGHASVTSSLYHTLENGCKIFKVVSDRERTLYITSCAGKVCYDVPNGKSTTQQCNDTVTK